MALEHFIYENRIDSMALQETGPWTPSMGSYKGKKVFSNKPDNLHGTAGVALILDQNLLPEIIDELIEDDVDAVWCQVKISGIRYLIGSVYCRPSNSVNDSNKLFDSLLRNIENARKYRTEYRFNSLLIYGDFNARHLDWGDHKTNQRGPKLLSYVEKEDLTICSPYDYTFVCNTGGSVIDLVLAEGPIVAKLGEQWIEKDAELFSGAPRRGHYPILQKITTGSSNTNIIPIKRNDWKNGNWKDWTLEVEANCWAQQLQQDEEMENGQKMWKCFQNIIQTANERHIPQKTICIHSKPYWNSELSNLCKEALEARDRFKIRATPTNNALLEEHTSKFRAALTESKNLWIRERLEGMNIKDSSQFWKQYKRVFGCKSDNYICNLKNQDILVTTDKEKELLLFETFFTGKHLKNQATDLNHERATERKYRNIISENSTQENEEESSINEEISLLEIRTAISKQDTTDKACDSDEIHPIILKHLGMEALSMLKFIYNWSLDNGSWLWNMSNVTFIRKDGKSSYMSPGAYRPISVSSYFGKILERIIDKRIRDMLSMEESNDEDQEGFMAGRSTTRYIFRLLANLEEVKRKKLACLILFLDFEKAFDSVHLPTLVVKLSKFGLKGKLIKLIHDFLFNRKICLRVNGFKGIPRRCTIFGLPQGAVLSPLFFILYVADMTEKIPETAKRSLCCYKFADDGTLMVSAANMQDCYNLMQSICDSLSQWCIKNKLVINCERNKTEVMILQTSARTSPHQQLITPPNLVINGKDIEYVKQTKVLGVTIDHALNFKAHALDKLKACNRKWALITKTTNRNHCLNARSLILLLKTTVLTKMFYAAPLWLKRNLEIYKSFWNKALMKISGAMLFPQRELTEIALHLPPLDIQLEVLTAKFMCKVLSSNDHLSSVIHQIDGTSKSGLHEQILSLKRFLMWKENKSRGLQRLDITLPEYLDMANYTKKEIQTYQQKIWLEGVENRIKHKQISHGKEEKIQKIIDQIRSKELQLGKDNFLFRFNTNKRIDSFVMDFVHGSSFIFGNIRGMHDDNRLCYFCNRINDSPEHQLVECEEIQDQTYQQLMSAWSSRQLEQLLVDIIAPENSASQVQKMFVERVAFLMEQHDSIDEIAPLN